MFRILLLLFVVSSCQTLYTDIPKGTTSDESITQLKLEYRTLSPYKVIGTVQNNSKKRVYDVRIRIDVIHPNQSVSTEHFVIAKINPYQNHTFKKTTEDTEGVEMKLQIQSSHY